MIQHQGTASPIRVKLHQLPNINPTVTKASVGGNWDHHLSLPLCVCVLARTLVSRTSGHSQRLCCHHSRANGKQQWIQRQRRVWLLPWEPLLCRRRTKQAGLRHQHEGRVQRDAAGRGGRPVLQRRWQVDVCSRAHCVSGQPRALTQSCFLASSSTGTCVTLPITAHCTMVRGEQRSSTFPRLAAWPRLTHWFLCCRPPYWPCWSSWRTPQTGSHSELACLPMTFYTQLLKTKLNLDQFIHLTTSQPLFLCIPLLINILFY